jgi:23S rRNA (uracil1939-C5)-methyltransferase
MATATASTTWQQGALIELTITDLSDRGDGVGRFEQRVVFVPDTVTGDRVQVRLVHVKPQFAHGKLIEILEPSPDRVRPSCIVADKCGGCQWQHISNEHQQQAKRNLVVQALQRIGGFESGILETLVEPMLPLDRPLHYRNKSTYPVGIAEASGQVIAGYYQKSSHQIVNLNQCPIQDDRLDPILKAVKQDIHTANWSIYNETTYQGMIRHIALRIGRRTGEKLLTIVAKADRLKQLQEYSQTWMEELGLVGVCLNLNSAKTNAIFGEQTHCIVGRDYLEEEFAGLKIQIRPETFFQVYTEQAEAMVAVIQDQLQLTGHEVVLDAYCGIGTLSLPLANRSQRIIGIEVQKSAIEQAQTNARINQIHNAEFHVGTVEKLLADFTSQPDVVILDPPRKGCDPTVIQALLESKPDRIVYMSCNPATLARDLQQLCNPSNSGDPGDYILTKVQPADFFPQTPHVETVVFLQRRQ